MGEEVKRKRRRGSSPKRTQVLHTKLAKAYIDELDKPNDGTPPKSKTELMLDVGYATSTARSKQAEVFSSEGFRSALAEAGLTQKAMSKVFTDAATAKTIVTYKGDAHETDAPDHKVRLQAVSLAGDFLGAKTKHVKVESVNLNLTAQDLADMLGT